MTDTRRARMPSATDQRDAIQRLLERMDQRNQAGFEELRSDVQGLRDHLGRTDARVENLAHDMQREVNHIDTRVGRMFEGNQADIAALRKALEDHETRTATEAAKGAAEGAAEGVAKVAIASPDDRAAVWRKSVWVKMGAGGVAMLAAMSLLKELAFIARGLEGLFAWLKNLK